MVSHCHGLRVCQECYDSALVSAWEAWDAENESDNDNPKVYPADQDLDKFVTQNFDEARSLLALAIAEAAYEFEHRDLHWGNILLRRECSATCSSFLKKKVYLYLLISTLWFKFCKNEDVLFLDLSSNPEPFEDPKGNKQANTYRKMRDVTDKCWEGSFPKTNVLWLQFLVSDLLLKKYEKSSKDKKELRSLKKRLNSYGSAKEAVSDPFFSGLLIEKL
ncbi:Non-specific serine/threonine protein kinase [Handroanthus impetiginosus]|uniref:non-specific serine/threonine protein kinase n=1 Tax=Handroanthus impetiginosus TaxID=429701 RepID=A0A2G9GZN3_9LAMI|nr:Non-specific serine/threonine protein kinase [Handroanthus impetiginosus]